jgi:hypothetical protein
VRPTPEVSKSSIVAKPGIPSQSVIGVQSRTWPRVQLPWFDLLFLSACAVVLAVQLFIPPFIGLANNGDFPKMTGRFSLGPQSGDWSENFYYFTADYVQDDKFHWVSDVVSSERVLVKAAVALESLFGRAGEFDVRSLGGIHSLLFLTAYLFLLLALRNAPKAVRFTVAAAALLIFTDVAYVAYFNSFYTDAVALLGLFLMLSVAVYAVASRNPGFMSLLAFAVAALLFITSKAQHALLGPLPAAALIGISWRRERWPLRYAGIVLAFVLLAASAGMFSLVPSSYKGQALFNLVFHQLPDHSQNFAADLAELGIDESNVRFRGMHAFQAESPAQDPAWLEEFTRHSGYGALLRFYLRHPERAFYILRDDLNNHAFRIRPHNLSNFQRKDAQPAGARTNAFAAWSNLRSLLFQWWPGHIIVWYAAMFLAAAWVWRKGNSLIQVRLSQICLALMVMAMLAFCVASLADGAETYRHLLLFHTMTDASVCFSFAAAAFYLPGLRQGQKSSPLC